MWIMMTGMKKVASVARVKKFNLYFTKTQWRGLQAASRKTGAPIAVIVRRLVAEFLKGAKKNPKR